MQGQHVISIQDPKPASDYQIQNHWDSLVPNTLNFNRNKLPYDPITKFLLAILLEVLILISIISNSNSSSNNYYI